MTQQKKTPAAAKPRAGAKPGSSAEPRASKAAADAAVEGVAVEDVSIEDTAVEGASIEDIAVEDATAEDSAARDSALEDVPIEDTVIEDVPVEDVSVEDVAVEDVSVEDVPVEDTAVEDVPVEDVPAQDNPTEEARSEQNGAADEPIQAPAADAVEPGAGHSPGALPGPAELPSVLPGAKAEDPIILAAPSPGADPGFAGSVTGMTPVIPTADPEQEPVFAAAGGWEPHGSPARTNGKVSGSGNGKASGKDAPDANADASNGTDKGSEHRSARREREEGPEPAAALTADRLLAKSAAPPVGGWRLWLYNASFGYINVGDSDRVRIQRAMEHRIAVRLGQRTRYVPVLSRKGGVGKTTVTTLLGMALADLREDRVIAMDANPDRGTLSDRSPGRADFTARQLVNDRFDVSSFSQLSHYVAREGSRLDVLASDTDPAVAHAFDDADYRAVTDILGRYYSIVLTDSGTGMVHSVMAGTLEKADAVVLVSGGSVDEARLASETLSWLEAHGRHDLVAKAIVVINMSGGEGTEVNINEIEDHFRSRVRNVLRIPYDRHLAEGSRVRLDALRPATRAAVVELAALVVDELQAG